MNQAMLRGRLLNTNTDLWYTLRQANKRFMRTAPAPSLRSAADFVKSNASIPSDLPHNEFPGRAWAKHLLDSLVAANQQTQNSEQSSLASRWSKHSLDTPTASPSSIRSSQPIVRGPEEISILAPVRRSRTSRSKIAKTASSISPTTLDSVLQSNSSNGSVEAASSAELPKVIADPNPNELTGATQAQDPTVPQAKAKKPRRQLRPRKALITLTPNALENLRGLLDQPEPQLIRIGVKNRGCSGLTYHLEYVSEPGKFDEIVEQDGVRVVIDSKALFSIVGSEMDWIDDKLSSRFIFRNPNSKGTCGCGESFMV